MANRLKPRMSVAQRAFLAGVRYGLRRAAKAKRRDVEDFMDETENPAEALRQALEADDDSDFDSGTRLS